jgi:E3 ubiquitin-protein ligase RFWD3
METAIVTTDQSIYKISQGGRRVRCVAALKLSLSKRKEKTRPLLHNHIEEFMAEPYITDEQDYEAMQLLEMGLELSESEYSEEDEDFIPVVELDSSPRFLLNSDQATTTTAAAAAENLNFQEEEVDVEEERNKRRRVEKLGSGGDICYRNGGDDAGGESSQNSQWNRSEFDGLFCPICMEAWTNEGDHHIWCLLYIYCVTLIFFSFLTSSIC